MLWVHGVCILMLLQQVLTKYREISHRIIKKFRITQCKSYKILHMFLCFASLTVLEGSWGLALHPLGIWDPFLAVHKFSAKSWTFSPFFSLPRFLINLAGHAPFSALPFPLLSKLQSSAEKMQKTIFLLASSIPLLDIISLE